MVSLQRGSDPWRLIGEVRSGGKAGEEVEVRGWIRTRRDSKAGLSFLEVNDGSSFNNLQIIAPATLANYESEIKKLGSGASVAVQGVLQESPGGGQAIELHASSVRVLGWADPDTYPLQKKRHSYEKLREWAHLRPRTNTFGAIARVRNQLSHSIHEFFQSRKFIYLHAPIITASDCEGAGQMFRVTTLDVEKLCRAGKPIDWSQDFFGKSAYLTVSGQLEGETYATALGRIYTFGPTFRAENSNTSRHLAEFWMIEPEVAFYELSDNMRLAEDFIRYLLQVVLEQCSEDMAFFEERIQPGLIDQLRGVADKSFTHLSYTEAVKILEQSGQKFEFPVKWGIDLQAEHERFLTEQHIKGPVILTDYPASIKPFYMRVSDDRRTVAAMDVLVPGVGEIIGGSQREERLDVLVSRMTESGLKEEDYWWYLDLRRFGTVPHAGFGLGLERLVQYVTGMANIRDVIPFPRTPGSAEF